MWKHISDALIDSSLIVFLILDELPPDTHTPTWLLAVFTHKQQPTGHCDKNRDQAHWLLASAVSAVPALFQSEASPAWLLDSPDVIQRS